MSGLRVLRHLPRERACPESQSLESSTEIDMLSRSCMVLPVCQICLQHSLSGKMRTRNCRNEDMHVEFCHGVAADCIQALVNGTPNRYTSDSKITAKYGCCASRDPKSLTMCIYRISPLSAGVGTGRLISPAKYLAVQCYRAPNACTP